MKNPNKYSVRIIHEPINNCLNNDLKTYNKNIKITEQKGKNKLPKTAIITSIYGRSGFGRYDGLKDPSVRNIPEEFDLYCFTEFNLKSDIWTVVNTPYHLSDKNDLKREYSISQIIKTESHQRNEGCAKYYRMNSHHIDILKKYKYFVWIDASITLHRGLIENILFAIKNNKKLGLYKLYYGSNSLVGYKDVVMNDKNLSRRHSIKKIDKQLKRFKDAGFDIDKVLNDIFHSGFIIRKNESKINFLFDEWWKENQIGSYLCEMSLPYMLWKHKIRPDIIFENATEDLYKHICEIHYYKNL